MIKDPQGREHLVLSDEDFYNDDIIGDSFEDYEILQVLSPNESKGFAAKVRSKINSKIYAMKKIESRYASKIQENQFRQEFEMLKKIDHPNVTKYFKYFFQDQCLYIISEYVNNSDINGLLKAYNSIEKPIEINTLWNIFMQSISALNYIHSQNIIHKNINMNNLFITEDKIVKLGDFIFSFLANNPEFNRKKTYHSPEMFNNLHFDQKTDIYAMGVIFHQLCYFSLPKAGKKNQNYYPKELENIIGLMLNEENNRPNAENLFNIIMAEYIKNVAKITSIDSVFRCMYSFLNFTKIICGKINNFSNIEKTPVSYNYANCINRYLSGEDPKNNAIYLNNFRNLLYKNSEINNEIEIKPNVVLEFLLEKLNKETGNNFNCPSLGIQPVIFNQNKDKSLAEFMSYFDQNFNSIISQYFVGFIKTKRICQKCREGLYSFNLFPFIEFDFDICCKYNNLESWFQEQNNHCLDLSVEHNVVCQKCRCVRPQNEFKQFYSLPSNFIISLNRGEGFINQNNINYPLVLDLGQKVEYKKSYSKFNLVGIVKRMIDNKGAEYYISIYLDPSKNCWILSDRYKLTPIKNPKYHNQGMIMLLFYSAIPTNIGL